VALHITPIWSAFRKSDRLVDDQKHGTKPTLPSYLFLKNKIFPTTFHCSLQIQILWSQLNVKMLGRQWQRVSCELRTCTKCNWHYVQDEEYVFSDCLTADLTELCIKHHHLLCTLSTNPNRLIDFISQAETNLLSFERPGLVCAWVPEMLCVDFRTPPCLPFDGFGCRPDWLQLSCPRSACAAS